MRGRSECKSAEKPESNHFAPVYHVEPLV
jgi:hypothetical protein